MQILQTGRVSVFAHCDRSLIRAKTAMGITDTMAHSATTDTANNLAGSVSGFFFI